MKIDNHIKDMKKYENKKQRILIKLRLAHPEIVKYCEEFIEMKKSKIDDKVLDNIQDIIVHCKTLYDLERYVLPYDNEFYDKILSKYKIFRPEPFSNDSIGLSNVKYKYETLAGTLDKTHFVYNNERSKKDDRPSLEDWFENDEFEGKNIRILANHKKDGTSVVAEFELEDDVYIPKRGISRGRKDYGEGSDVTPVIDFLKVDPKPLKKFLKHLPKKLGIQYEFVLSDDQKKKLEEYLNMKFANNRSAASSLMRRLIFAKGKEKKELQKLVSLVPVGFEMKNSNDYKWDELYNVLTETFIYGDVLMGYQIIQENPKNILKEIREYADKMIAERNKLNHDIDGLVVTILNQSLQEKLGRKNSINKYQVALKFPEEEVKTKVVGLITTTGAFGYKEFLAEVEPVILNGTKQSKGQLHSLDKFNIFDLRIGDEVILKLSGDVIPYMYKDATCKRGNGPRLELPTKCECGTILVEEKNKLRCPNINCKCRIVGGLTTFLKEVNSKGIGDKTCEQLYEELGITKPSQMLELTERDFLSLKGFKSKSAKAAEKTIQEIRKKERKESVILSAIGIDSFRTSTAEKVLSKYKLSEILTLCQDKNQGELEKMLKKVDGIDNNASVISKGMIENIDEIVKVLSLMTSKKVKMKDPNAKVILISGMRNDEELEEVAEANGYIVKDSGKKFDILVIASDESRNKSKGKLAKELGKPIYTRKEFIDKYK